MKTKDRHKRIRIGKRVVGFVCGHSECLPIFGPIERLPEKPIIKQLTLKQRINKATKEIQLNVQT